MLLLCVGLCLCRSWNDTVVHDDDDDDDSLYRTLVTIFFTLFLYIQPIQFRLAKVQEKVL